MVGSEGLLYKHDRCQHSESGTSGFRSMSSLVVSSMEKFPTHASLNHRLVFTRIPPLATSLSVATILLDMQIRFVSEVGRGSDRDTIIFDI